MSKERGRNLSHNIKEDTVYALFIAFKTLLPFRHDECLCLSIKSFGSNAREAKKYRVEAFKEFNNRFRRGGRLVRLCVPDTLRI